MIVKKGTLVQIQNKHLCHVKHHCETKRNHFKWMRLISSHELNTKKLMIDFYQAEYLL